MLKLTPIGLICVLLTGCSVSSGAQQSFLSERAVERETALLAGKTAGEPQNCIMLSRVTDTSIIDENTILYETASTIYRNEIPGGCPTLDSRRGITVSTPSPNLCAGEIIRVRDRHSNIELGGCALGQFTPYNG